MTRFGLDLAPQRTSRDYTHVFTGRAALLHLGAFTATIMSANVFLVIIPNQEIVVADLKAGRTPDPKYGAIAKLRSTHNNYLTLPVLFLMLSNHYPLAFATEYNWIIASLVFPHPPLAWLSLSTELARSSLHHCLDVCLIVWVDCGS